MRIRGHILACLRHKLFTREARADLVFYSNRLKMASATISGLDSKTLTRDEPLPSLTPGSLRLYNMRFCPFAERTVIALAHKSIPTEVVNVNLKEKPAWLLEKNPLGKVPILEKDDRIIYESGVCNEYLDQIYPQAKILPDDPYLAAQQKMLAERLSGMQRAIQVAIRSPELHIQFFESFVAGNPDYDLGLSKL